MHAQPTKINFQPSHKVSPAMHVLVQGLHVRSSLAVFETPQTATPHGERFALAEKFLNSLVLKFEKPLATAVKNLKKITDFPPDEVLDQVASDLNASFATFVAQELASTAKNSLFKQLTKSLHVTPLPPSTTQMLDGYLRTGFRNGVDSFIGLAEAACLANGYQKLSPDKKTLEDSVQAGLDLATYFSMSHTRVFSALRECLVVRGYSSGAAHRSYDPRYFAVTSIASGITLEPSESMREIIEQITISNLPGQPESQRHGCPATKGFFSDGIKSAISELMKELYVPALTQFGFEGSLARLW